MANFIFKFAKAPGAKPVAGDQVIVPDFSDQTAQLGAHDFKLNGDASAVDLSGAGKLLKYIRFSNSTKFPSLDKMPDGFNPEQVLQDGINPGLHVTDLHKLGITGKNITVAIIDQPLNTEHIEIKDNIIHYEVLGYPENGPAAYHGTAVSSILAGKTLGVAPDTKIVYFAANHTIDNSNKVFAEPEIKAMIEKYLPDNVKYNDFIKDINKYPDLVLDIKHKLPPEVVKRIEKARTDTYFDDDATALRKILFMNSRLPKDKKISAVSISWGRLGEDPECTKLINMLIKSGVMVLTTDSQRFYENNAEFTTIDKQMNSDADDVESYEAGFWKQYLEKTHNNLLIPAGGRTIAGFYDNTQYIYCGANGGMSWATPYLVGVYALAKQVSPNLTPEHFFDIAHKVGAHDKKMGDNVFIQPQKIVEYLQKENVLQNIETKNR